MTLEASSVAAPADTPARCRERARKARTIAARYRGEAHSLLIEIADELDARAARLEAQGD
jgi:hypothetical protein